MARSVSKTRQNAYASYKSSQKWKQNRERKLLKLIKQHPNNLQLQKALDNISYRRGTPKAPRWSHSAKAKAQLLNEFKVRGVVEKTKFVRPPTTMATAFAKAVE